MRWGIILLGIASLTACENSVAVDRTRGLS
jgi:hypothetical protein